MKGDLKRLGYSMCIAFILFYLLFIRDELRVILNWKKNVKIVFR